MKKFTGIEFKKKYGTNFYKILNENLCHDNYKYVEGENIEIENIDENIDIDSNRFYSNKLLLGGLFFSNLKKIYSVSLW